MTRVSIIAAAAALGGCGTFVPGVQEIWVPRDQAPIFIQKLSRSVQCELRNAVNGIIRDDIAAKNAGANYGERLTSWLDSWGVQTTLTLSIEEESSLNPGVSLNQVLRNATSVFPGAGNVSTSQLRSLGFGGSVKATALRTNKINSFYTVQELGQDLPDCSRTQEATGSPLIESDLGLREWVSAMALVSNTRDVGFPKKLQAPINQNAFSHEIKFQLGTNGSVTPGIKLVDVAVNQGNTPFFNTRRDRTHSLAITFGPTAATEAASAAEARRAPRRLASTAAGSALASEIGISVVNGIRSALQP